MKRILILMPHYLPGNRYGGPVRTVRNLCEHLGDEFEFHILTVNRDLGSNEPYDVNCGEWMPCGKARIMYHAKLDSRILEKHVHELQPDLVYLNSLWHPSASLLPVWSRRFRGWEQTRLLIAVRGELNPGALEIKAFKKRLYLRLARLSRVYRSVEWQATSAQEAQLIQTHFHPEGPIHVAANLPRCAPVNVSEAKQKEMGHLRLLFLGRVSRMKNLDFLLQRLPELRGQVELHIAGTMEDEVYWKECQRLIQALPGNICVKNLGELEPEAVPQQLSGYDLLAIPSLGENYGHAIVEALQQSVPVLISDRTPWQDLESKEAGWSLPLEKPQDFERALQAALDMGAGEWARLKIGAGTLGQEIGCDTEVLNANRNMLAGLST